jgi:hypothetical protein
MDDYFGHYKGLYGSFGNSEDTHGIGAYVALQSKYH